MQIDDLYLTIAHDMIDNIESDWDSATVLFVNAEDAGEFQCTFQLTGGDEQDFDVSIVSYNAFKQLHELTGGEWEKAKFSLQATGKFSIDFE